MWPNWNASAKDTLLKQLYKDMVEFRIEREMNVTPDMYVPIHYMSNPQCVASLRNALCWYNFPKCNDANRSLPMCDSTCQEYYKNCKYPGAIGAFGACSDGAIDSKGLFDSGVKPGPDQKLAADRPKGKSAGEPNAEETCQRRPTDDEIGIIRYPPAPLWYTTWWGIVILSIIGILVVLVLSFLLIPPVLMDYLIATGIRFAKAPYRAFMRLPQMRGLRVLQLLAFLFLLLLGSGVFMMQGGFSRWDAFKDTSSDTIFQFTPVQFIWGQQVMTPLSNEQLKQLQMSCTCTGGARRGVPDVMPWLVAAAVHHFFSAVNEFALSGQGCML